MCGALAHVRFGPEADIQQGPFMNYCFLNGLFSWVPQKYDKFGSLIVVHDLPGLVTQNGNGQVSAVAVGFFFSFAAAPSTACFLNGLFSWVPQKYDKFGSLIVVHDLPGLVTQNGNGQVSAIAVGFFFSFAPACGTAPTKKKFAAMPTVNALINFDFIASSSSFYACSSRDLLRAQPTAKQPPRLQ